MPHIRCKAIVIVQHQNSFLFTDCIERSTGRRFFIPVGGGVEFGEYSIDAVTREVKEETGQEIENIQLLTISENIFEYGGVNEHEIVFIYKADFKDKQAYYSALKGGINSEGNEIKLIWAGLDEIKQKNICLYPKNLIHVIEGLV